jgi:hypothetical protein
VQTVTGSAVDNTDPLNPVVNLGSSTTSTLEEVTTEGNLTTNDIRISSGDGATLKFTDGEIDLITIRSSGGGIDIIDETSGRQLNLDTTLLTDNREQKFPDKDGTFAMLSDITGGVTDGDKGDITVSGSGTVWTIDNGLDATKIADGSVSNTEFQRLDGVTGNIQTQIDAKADKSTSAYSIKANNTASTANETEFTFRQSGLSSYSGTITWTGTTAPSGAESHTFNWQQIGNLVQLNLNLHYATGGSGLTAVVISLPSDLPNPIKPTGFDGASERLYIGSGRLASSDSGALASTNECFLRSNSGNNGFEIVIQQSSLNAKVAQLTIEYFTS